MSNQNTGVWPQSQARQLQPVETIDIATWVQLVQRNGPAARDISASLQGSGFSEAQILALARTLGVAPTDVGRVQQIALLAGADAQLTGTTGREGALGTLVNRLVAASQSLGTNIVASANRNSVPSQNTAQNPGRGNQQDILITRLLTAVQNEEQQPGSSYDNGLVRVAIFDSGSGALVAGETIERYLDTNGDGRFVTAYVTDHGADTYGTKEPREIATLTNQGLRYAQDVLKADLIVMACNTATGTFNIGGRDGVTIPVVDLIRSTSDFMIREGGSHPAMFATPYMTDTGLYQNALWNQGTRLTAIPCPKWAKFVNEGDHLNPNKFRTVYADIKNRVAQLPLNTTAVFLNCTHYPALRDLIQRAIAERWHKEAPGQTPPRVLDPMVAQADAALTAINQLRSQGDIEPGNRGNRVVVTSGNATTVADEVFSRYGETPVFSVNEHFVFPPTRPSAAFAWPPQGVPLPITELLNSGEIGFTTGSTLSFSRLPYDVWRGYDLNYTPATGSDDRFLRLRQAAYREIDALPPAIRDQARSQVDRIIASKSAVAAAYPPLPVPAGLSENEARVITRVVQRFANRNLTDEMDPSRLPPAPTSEAIRTAIFNELLAGHVPRQRAIEITRRMEQDIENWVVDINVQRNDLVHQLAVSIAEALSQLQRP